MYQEVVYQQMSGNALEQSTIEVCCDYEKNGNRREVWPQF